MGTVRGKCSTPWADEMGENVILICCCFFNILVLMFLTLVLNVFIAINLFVELSDHIFKIN